MPNAFNLTRETDRAKVRYIDKDGSKRNAEENIFESNESKESKEHCEQTERVRERERERETGAALLQANTTADTIRDTSNRMRCNKKQSVLVLFSK